MTALSRTLRETRGRREVGVVRVRYRRARGVRTMGRGMIRRTILMEVTGRSPLDSLVCLLNGRVRMHQTHQFFVVGQVLASQHISSFPTELKAPLRSIRRSPSHSTDRKPGRTPIPRRALRIFCTINARFRPMG